jgi:endonuclease/exonuclease/phosphatase family metal-dependent hydrolase
MPWAGPFRTVDPESEPLEVAMRRFRSFVTASVGALALLGLSACSTPPAPRIPHSVTVMTQNLYEGTDVTPVLEAQTPAEVFAAVAAAWAQVQANDFATRAKAIAAEIDSAHPDLVGLQEAVLFRTQTPADGPATPATTVAYDYVEILVDALHDRGLDYEPISVATGFDAELTGVFATGPMDIRLTQREVILVRKGTHGPTVTWSNAQHGQYAAHISVPTPFPGLTIPLPWAWASVDAAVGSSKFRFVTTHLDSQSTTAQEAQAAELVTGPAAGPLPVVLVGDFNSPADGSGSTSRQQIIDAGFSDAWSSLHPLDPGLTCCQSANLDNATSGFTRRIDMVMTHGGITPLTVDRVGDLPIGGGVQPNWASDHAGVVATLQLPA